MDYKDIERSIVKKFRKTIWVRFIRAINEYELIKVSYLPIDKEMVELKKKKQNKKYKGIKCIIKEFDEKKSTLNAQISEITQMGNKISQYDEAIKELTQMSLAVEENLARIKKEFCLI